MKFLGFFLIVIFSFCENGMAIENSEKNVDMVINQCWDKFMPKNEEFISNMEHKEILGNVNICVKNYIIEKAKNVFNKKDYDNFVKNVNALDSSFVNVDNMIHFKNIKINSSADRGTLRSVWAQSSQNAFYRYLLKPLFDVSQ